MKLFALALTAVALMPSVAIAGPVVITSATPSTQYPGYGAIYAIDQGGNSVNTDWASFQQGAGSYLDLTFAGLYNLNSVTVTDRVTSGGPNSVFYGGLSDYTTQFSLTYFTDASFTIPVAGAAYTFNRPQPTSTASPSDFAFTTPLSTAIPTQYVRYSVVVTNGVNPGLSNISFSAVPEPATWALMLLGFGMVGFGLRYRRSSQTAGVKFV